MTRGYLSVRIDPSNRAHHLYLNNGHYWVHYTLHFDFRKRRIRRSLKTRSLEVAIQRRDELFARLQAEGEPIQGSDMLPFPSRPLRVNKADVVCRAADACLERGEFIHAAEHYETAAVFYRRAELGLLSRRCWLAAAEAWERGGRHHAAERCRSLASSVPTYWGDTA